jgi:hypothetical protein
VPAELETVADPRFVLLAWGAGLALVAGGVSLARIVGPGFTWLTGGFAGALGLAGWAIEGAIWSRLVLLLVTLAMVRARNRGLSGSLLILASVGYLIDAAGGMGWVLTATGALALGGVTGEMALGHWYLVDPRLPRWALRGLAVLGVLGLVADGIGMSLAGELVRSGPVFALLALLVASVVLMVAVLGALRYPAYSGVMAATGLSYLAVLTSLGAAFLGRALIAGIGPFAN